MSCYNLFISHSWAYGDAYEKLLQLLNNQKSYFFDYKNYSVPKYNPIYGAQTDAQLYVAIKAKILPCRNVIILAGVYSTYSKWINLEIRIAKELGKKIIAIEPWGAERTSQVVKNNADYIIPWRGDSLVKAIQAIKII